MENKQVQLKNANSFFARTMKRWFGQNQTDRKRFTRSRGGIWKECGRYPMKDRSDRILPTVMKNGAVYPSNLKNQSPDDPAAGLQTRPFRQMIGVFHLNRGKV